MKKEYITPEIAVAQLSAEDSIMASTNVLNSKTGFTEDKNIAIIELEEQYQYWSY